MNEQHLAVAIEAARAGAVELMSRRESRTVQEKGPKDLVTDADLASQRVIRSRLLSAFNDWNPQFCVSGSKAMQQSMVGLLSERVTV